MICYVCKAKMEPFLDKNGFRIFRCINCGFLRTELKTNYEKFVKSFYSKGYFTGSPKYSAFEDYKNDQPYIRKNMQTFLRQIKKIKPNGKLLDVGCAMGFFVELALEHGYDAYGCDPSKFAIDEANAKIQRRLKVTTIEEAIYRYESFDVITLFDVFEHLQDPEKDIVKLYQLLKNGGIVVIATGDTDSKSANIMKRRWTFYNPPQHLVYFNRSNLTTVLVRNNLEPIKWFRIGKWLSLGYVLHLARTLAESRIADSIYQIIKSMDSLNKIPLFLPMQDNMVVIAQKKYVQRQK